jgi:hypothetical protein
MHLRSPCSRRLALGLVILSASAFLAAGCASTSTGEQREHSFNGIVRAAKNAVRKERPEWSDELDLPARVTEMDGKFRVSFALPQGTIGGTPEVVLRKSDLSVVSVSHSQ